MERFREIEKAAMATLDSEEEVIRGRSITGNDQELF